MSCHWLITATAAFSSGGLADVDPGGGAGTSGGAPSGSTTGGCGSVEVGVGSGSGFATGDLPVRHAARCCNLARRASVARTTGFQPVLVARTGWKPVVTA